MKHFNTNYRLQFEYDDGLWVDRGIPYPDEKGALDAFDLFSMSEDARSYRVIRTDYYSEQTDITPGGES